MRGKFFIICLLTIFPINSSFAQWAKLKSPRFPIQLHPYAVASKGNTLFVGTYQSTIYRSFDGGSTWMRSDFGISFLYWTYDFLITQNTVFAMGEEGIFRSTDWGNSWELKNNGLRHTSQVIDVYAMVKLNNLLLAGTDYGVYSSSDNGDNWTSTTGDTITYNPIYSLAVLNGVLFEATESDGAYYSNDYGHTWNAANKGLPTIQVYAYRINKLFVDGVKLYAGLNSKGIYISTDNGNSWLPDTSGLGNSNPYREWYTYDIYSFAKIGNYLYAGTMDGGIYRKNDAENSWTAVNFGLPANSYVTSIIEYNGRILAAAISGLYSSSINNINWKPLLTKYTGNGNIKARYIAFCGDGRFLSLTSNYDNGSADGVFSFSNNGIWSLDSVLSNNFTYFIQSYGDSMYANGIHLLFSSDQGNNWKQIDSGLTDINTIIKKNDTLFIGTGGSSQYSEIGEVYFSANNGKTWNKIWSGDTAISAITKIDNDLICGSSYGTLRTTD